MAVLLFDVVFSARRPRQPTKRECAMALSFYVGLAVLFSLWVWFFHCGQYGLEFFAGWLTEYINGGEHVNVPEIPTLFSLAVIVVTLVITTVVASLYKTRVVEKG